MEKSVWGGGKIKVRIVHSSPTGWNAIETICQAFKEDAIFDLLIILGNYMDESTMIKQVERNGYNFIKWENYQGSLDKPDILILSGFFDKAIEGILDCRKYVKLTVVATWTVVRYESSIEDFFKRFNRSFALYRPDYYLFDSLQYTDIKNSVYYTKKIVEKGNAKYDGIYQAIKKKRYKKAWEKIKGKKTILWATSHGISSNQVIQKGFTFDLYAKTFFDYANENQDMGFIFRPSVGMVDEMLKFGFWTHNDLELLKKYCESSANLIYDDTDTYNEAISIADAILTDAFCGIMCSMLPTLKPICITYRYKNENHYYKELSESCYAAFNSQDLLEFFQMIRHEQDPMLDVRRHSAEKFVKHFDGKNGWRIKEFVKRKFFDKAQIIVNG